MNELEPSGICVSLDLIKVKLLSVVLRSMFDATTNVVGIDQEVLEVLSLTIVKEFLIRMRYTAMHLQRDNHFVTSKDIFLLG